ncbi:hypothetical protein PMAYCL1PPCAC_32095 [Pristionchus mayeri]|uniref:Uncharacterized protein n=1 Tax=Pristionchus mayeri TaxID=1317129 RepID=A0AAN5DGW5_9BILA|nr:hypothetical protein PMAYCL1PPCAC_32095 [Pristionchus mayeri]
MSFYTPKFAFQIVHLLIAVSYSVSMAVWSLLADEHNKGKLDHKINFFLTIHAIVSSLVVGQILVWTCAWFKKEKELVINPDEKRKSSSAKFTDPVFCIELESPPAQLSLDTTLPIQSDCAANSVISPN